MKKVLGILAAALVLSITTSSAWAIDASVIRSAAYGPSDHAQIVDVHGYWHGGYWHGGYYGAYRPVIVAPAPVYTYPAPVVVPTAPAPVTTYYPPAYPAPYGYYAYPRAYFGYRTRGLSVGVGL